MDKEKKTKQALCAKKLMWLYTCQTTLFDYAILEAYG